MLCRPDNVDLNPKRYDTSVDGIEITEGKSGYHIGLMIPFFFPLALICNPDFSLIK